MEENNNIPPVLEREAMSPEKYPGFKDCHFFGPARCAALTSFECKNVGKCKFYKTEEQWREDLKKYPAYRKTNGVVAVIDGERLKEEMAGKGLTQKDIAKQLGKSGGFIGDSVRRGYMEQTQLRKIAEILGVDYECLLKKESSDE